MPITDSGHADQYANWDHLNCGRRRWIILNRWGILFVNKHKEEAMSQKGLSMRKIEEVLRLKYEVGLSHRAIAQSCSVSPSTVSEYVTHAKAAGLSWPLPEGVSAEELDDLLFPQRGPTSGRNIPQPDWAEVHK